MSGSDPGTSSPVTDHDRYLFDVRGWLVLRGVLGVDEVAHYNGLLDRLQPEPDGLMVLAPLCRLKNERAHQVIADILDAIAGWRTVAANNGLQASEIAQFGESFYQERHLLTTLLKPPH